MSNIICIGLTGPIAGGKGETARLLREEFGFAYFSLSDRVREVAKSRSVEMTRENLQNVGDEMRRAFGGDIWARLTAALAFVSAKERVAIDGIRNPAEVAFFRDHPGFALVAVRAPQNRRAEWAIARAKSGERPSDPKTLEGFLERDRRDLGVGQDILGQQVGRCVEMANITIENIGTQEELRATARKVARMLLSS